MKRYAVWFFLLMKRTIKKPAFLLFLVFSLVCILAMNRLEQGEKSETVIGIVLSGQEETTPEETTQEETTQEETTQAENIKWQETFWKLLQRQDGILEFKSYEDADALILAIKKEEIDCGFVLPEDFATKVQENDWQESITVYESSESRMTEFAKERIACAAFTLYAEESYVNYIEQSDSFPESEEILTFAKEAYQSHLVDGSTFSFAYQKEENHGEEVHQPDVSAGFPLRGILAICIFLSGMCGLLTDWDDRREKRFVRITPNWMTTAVNIWIPTIYTSLMALLALTLTGKIGKPGKELISLLVYQFLIVWYCSIIRLILRKQETIAVSIPILTLAALICCPVWIRLALYVPLFAVLEKLFPVTYYLMMAA
ncbi:MAG: hypothetical protein PUD93_11920 [Lachnospiraceae bacterium]|nr:hypothetical protein [Lachnospiraceae bacterium]